MRKRKLKRMMFKSFDGFIYTCKKIAKKWDMNTIPLITLKTSIDILKQERTGHAEYDKFLKEYNIVLDDLYKACEKVAKKMKSDSVPIDTVEYGINVIKKAFIKAA